MFEFFFLLFNITNITQLQNMSVHLCQQWIKDIYKYTYTGYVYIIKRYRHIDSHTDRVGQVLHRQIFVLHIEWQIACHMCIHSKSKITTFTLSLSVFYCQNRLLTEPIQVESGQLAVELWTVFIYFVFQQQLKETGQS